jgi:tetratricopeptide (TPR) repeat protein
VGQKLVWNVPYPPNPLFTGREELLKQLETSLQKGQSTALSQPQAISGLGGIGKTQLALEYAYRSRHDYQAILWALADTRENLTSSYLAFASLLDLPEQRKQESARVITAVKTWLQTHTDWLLILDNADDLALTRDFLPPSFAGHALLTTRAYVTGRFAQRLEVNVLSPEQGTLFLLRRAGRLAADATLEQASEQERDQARMLCEELGWLPLALDQAGAYIEETQCGLTDYLQRYQTSRARLLKWRGDLITDHPLPVATTWSLSFQNVEQKNPAAADLLRLCAFLAPDAIPEELITQGAAVLGPILAPLALDPMELDEAIAALGAYSLLSRDPNENALSVHRLVQAVLKDMLDEQSSQLWAERVVQVVNAVLPSVEHGQWSLWERILAHALVCLELIELHHLYGAEATRLLQQTGWYLTERVRYQEAELFLTRALSISEHEHGLEHLDTARDSSTLGYLYKAQGKYEEAEPLLVRVLAIQEQHLGPEQPNITNSLNNLAALYQDQGKYEQAEPLYMQALSIREQHLGPLHPDTATSLNNLALLYKVQGKYKEAELLYMRALSIREQHLGPEHPNTATSLNNLADLYQSQGKYKEAEPLLVRALTIREQHLGPEHPNTATSLNNLAVLYQNQGKYEQAEPLYQRTLAIDEKAYGTEHPEVATDLSYLADLYRTQGKYKEAEPLLVRALAIAERILGKTHPSTRTFRANYADLLRAMNHEDEARALEQRKEPL